MYMYLIVFISLFYWVVSAQNRVLARLGLTLYEMSTKIFNGNLGLTESYVGE